MEILVSIIVTSLFCCGVRVTTSPDKILYPLRYSTEKLLSLVCSPSYVEYLMKPLFTCVICMGSVWGSVACLLQGIYSVNVVVLTISGAAFLNGLLIETYQKLNNN